MANRVADACATSGSRQITMHTAYGHLAWFAVGQTMAVAGIAWAPRAAQPRRCVRAAAGPCLHRLRTLNGGHIGRHRSISWCAIELGRCVGYFSDRTVDPNARRHRRDHSNRRRPAGRAFKNRDEIKMRRRDFLQNTLVSIGTVLLRYRLPLLAGGDELDKFVIVDGWVLLSDDLASVADDLQHRRTSS